ncbi:ABC transporter permease [Ideonella sp.]|uniref:ABC transporter permease n=1 Tax=Ideonella sp. TaxID=1929293 RepID=UPI003BB4B0D6
MLSYYFELALRSFKAAKGLTVLMLLTIGLGVGASMTTLAIFHVLSGDPIPHKSDQLFNIQLDAWPMRGYEAGQEPTLQLTRLDAQNLLREAKADRQVMMVGGGLIVEPVAPGQSAMQARTRYASADFFAMFEAPFALGSGWTAADDAAEARVVVLSHSTNERLFGGADSRGKILQLGDKAFRVIGVLAPWRPVPHYYDLTTGKFNPAEDLYMPFSTAIGLKFGSSGNFNCWADHPPETSRDVGAPCAWIQYWAEASTPAKAQAYLQYLKNYSDLQRQAGRFERPTNVRMRAVMDWLATSKVVPADLGLQLWLAFGFLAVCLVNTVSLLLAKCLRRSGEIGVRRALGASRRAIFAQFLVEAGTLGLAGGLLGLLLTWLGLWAVRQGSNPYAALVGLDGTMLLTTLGLALLASLLAGLLPAWRACQVTPALQLKTQ